MAISIVPLICKDAIRKEGTTAIYIRVTINRKAKPVATDFLIEAKNWNCKTNEVGKGQPLASSINLALQSMVLRMKQKVYELLRDNDTITHDKIFSVMKSNSALSFNEYALDEIKNCDVPQSQKDKLEATVAMFNGCFPTLMIEDVSPRIIEQFKSFLSKQITSIITVLLFLAGCVLYFAKLTDGYLKINPLEGQC